MFVHLLDWLCILLKCIVMCRCTDPELCKGQILEDFQHERPLWKLTCYGHGKRYIFLTMSLTGTLRKLVFKISLKNRLVGTLYFNGETVVHKLPRKTEEQLVSRGLRTTQI